MARRTHAAWASGWRPARRRPPSWCTSPLLRARQTAEAIARASGAELRVDARLAPGATAADLRAAVGEGDLPVATVGHQPDCSEIAVALTGRDPGFPPAWDGRDRASVVGRWPDAAAARALASVHMATAISVRDLHKSYDGMHAVRGISFDVAVGEVFGLLGPNGAGKTTTVEVLEGYRTRTRGRWRCSASTRNGPSARSGNGSASSCSSRSCGRT